MEQQREKSEHLTLDRSLREELLREAELAALAERQQELAEELKLTRTLLPVVNGDRGQIAGLNA